ncbi:hypothetical protein [Gottfriedia sp. OAE603]|uniref:hypothetical protein n=1 Tax=Gottfriedia sp. OAE603 TaxID=2663872 RepID=UPI0019F3CE43
MIGRKTKMSIRLKNWQQYVYSASNDPFNPEKTTTFYHIDGISKYVGDFDQFVGHITKLELAYNA